MDVLGEANSNTTVTLWTQDTGGTPGQPGDPQGFFRTIRKSDYFRGEISFNNSTGAVWLNITNLAVLTNTTNPDIIATKTGGTYAAQTPEVFQYDADGNLTNDGHWSYTWDGENRLIGMSVTTKAGPQYQLSFVYDYQGRRIQKNVATNGVGICTNDFLYDGWSLIAILNSQSTISQSFVWGTDLSGSPQDAGGVGGLLEVANHSANANFVAYDGAGNIAALVNAIDGTTTANYEYGPFGEQIRMIPAHSLRCHRLFLRSQEAPKWPPANLFEP